LGGVILSVRLRELGQKHECQGEKAFVSRLFLNKSCYIIAVAAYKS
jgi:hypothetical protein